MAVNFIEYSDYQLQRTGQHARIGMVALATDFWSDKDLVQMSPSGVEIYTNRVMNENPVRMENLKAMSSDMVRAAHGILPGTRLDALIYSCTSGTVAIGEDNVIAMLKQVHPDAHISTPVTAATKALEALDISRCCILTPYIHSVNQAIAQYFTQRGFDITQLTGFSIDNDDDMTAVSPQSIYEAAVQSFDSSCDGLFISCTALRATHVIDKIEQKIGKPVVSSNQSMLWHVLEMIAKPYEILGYGRLFSHRLKN